MQSKTSPRATSLHGRWKLCGFILESKSKDTHTKQIYYQTWQDYPCTYFWLTEEIAVWFLETLTPAELQKQASLY